MRPIQAGDLVMVVKPTLCCGSTWGLGEVFRVVCVREKEGGICGRCGAEAKEQVALCDDLSGAQVCRLIRIDPPAKMEESERELEVVA